MSNIKSFLPADDRQILIEKMRKYIDGEGISSPEHEKGKRKRKKNTRLWSESEEEVCLAKLARYVNPKSRQLVKK